MAGLGFKDFAVGEVLTSADVDGYLMQQTVMRFADSGARGSALGTATGTAVPLAEGMLSYLQDTDAVQVYNGSAWTSVMPGIGINVVQVLKTDTFSASLAAGSATTVTGLSVSITPTTDTSKVLVLCQITGGRAADSRQYGALRADGSLIEVGAADGSRQRIGTGWGVTDANATSGGFLMALHSPATTSSVTYDVVISHSNSTTDTVYVNRGPTDSDAVRHGRSASSIVVIEVAA